MTATLLDTQVNSKDLKVLSKDIKDIEENESGDFFEQIITSLLGKAEDQDTKDFLMEKLLNMPENFDFEEKLVSNLSKDDIDVESSDETAEVLVEDLLKLSFMIKNDIDVKDFPTNSKELKVASSDKNIVSEFKDAKNINDLLDIAKKHNINVKKFEFSTEKFSQDLQEKQNQTVKNMKSEDVLKMIEKKLNNFTNFTDKMIKNSVHNTTHKENTLKNILSTIKVDNKKANIIDTKIEKNKVLNITPKINRVDVKEEVYISTKKSIEKSIENSIDEKVQQIQTNKVQQVKNPEKSKATQIKVVEQVKSSEVKKDIKKQQPSKIQEVSENTYLSDTDRDKKIEIKERNIQQSFKQTIKNTENSIKQTAHQTLVKTVQESEKSEVKEFSAKENEQSVETKIEHTTQVTKNNPPTKQKIDVKHTINTFAQDFKEQVESYKPPLMKVKMQLNPQGLGDVDVTMVNRGNNLHITVNSNPNTIAIFSQNQTEFKNSLVNMGFSELNMSFNENGKNKDNNQNQKNKNSSNQSFEEEQPLDSFEVVTPIYV